MPSTAAMQTNFGKYQCVYCRCEPRCIASTGVIYVIMSSFIHSHNYHHVHEDIVSIYWNYCFLLFSLSLIFTMIVIIFVAIIIIIVISSCYPCFYDLCINIIWIVFTVNNVFLFRSLLFLSCVPYV